MKNKRMRKNAKTLETVHTHTHTHTRDLLTNKESENKKAIKIQGRENKEKNKSFRTANRFLNKTVYSKTKTGSKGRKKIIKRKNGEPVIIDLNLSLTIIKTVLIIAIILLITAQVALTILKTQKKKNLSATQEEKPKVTYVSSKKIDENREEVLDENKDPIDDTRTVPVPAGYTASQVPGERSIDTGFVIYEGDINWADYINKDDIYNKDPNIGVEKPVKIKSAAEETSVNQWVKLDNGTYTSGYVDEEGRTHENQHKDNIENKLISNEFTLEQPKTLIIKWSVSSEIEDKLYYTIKNTKTGELIGGEETAISGIDAGTSIDELIYTDTEVSLDAGTYEIEFTYKKNGSNSEGLDAGFVKRIEKKIEEVDFPEVKFIIPEGDGTTENNHHWLQYEDGTYVSGYIDETGKTYGNYHVPNSENILTSEEFTIEKDAVLNIEYTASSEVIEEYWGGGTWDYTYNDYLYYIITNTENGEEVCRGSTGDDYYDTYESLCFGTESSEKMNPGTYTISFIYKKNESQDRGLDAGFVRNVKLENAEDSYIWIDFNVRGECVYQGGEYEEGVWSTGYIKDDKLYGNYHINNSNSILETEEITLTGNTTLKFEWSVSSEGSDQFYYKITNTETNEVIGGWNTRIAGTSRGTEYSGLIYEEKTIYLNSGTYKIEYIYSKNYTDIKGLDAGFVKNIRTVKTCTKTEFNILNLQKSTNQYVWVPISEYELEEIYGVDRNGKLWGKLYDGNYNPTTTHSKSGLNWTILDDGTMSITNPIGYREPDVTRNINYDIDRQLPTNLTGETRYELLSRELEQGYYKTIESIKKYGGFYIGRYETGYSGVVQKMRFER